MRISTTDLREVLNNPKLKNGEWIARCPFCGKDQHFYLSETTFLFDCKKCGQQGNLTKLLRQVDRLDLLDNYHSATDDFIFISDEEEKKELEEIDMSFPPYRELNFYLKKRGLSEEDLNRYDIRYRIRNIDVIFPCYWEGKCVAFVLRKCVEADPKYLNSHSEFSRFLYIRKFEDMDFTGNIILTEGVFDKIAMDRVIDAYDLDYRSVATFGKVVSNDQFDILKNANKIVFSYDRDAIDNVKKYGKRFSDIGVDVEVLIPDGKDVGEQSVFQNYKNFERKQKLYELNFVF